MGFLWGKKDEFEKDNNTLRGAYKLNPSFGFIDKKKYFEVPIIVITNKHYEETFSGFGGGMCYESNVSYSDFVEYFFGHEYNEDTLDNIFGGVAYKSEVTYSSYIEYRFFHLPFSGGYTDTMDNILGGMVYKSEVTYEG
jgi:hypothetical protein